MGTNFYARINPCKTCGEAKEVIHIGKSSFGWTFTFHATEEIKSYKQWLEILSSKKVKIFDEYDREISLKNFKELVEDKRKSKYNHAIECKNDEYDKSYLDEEGNSMSKGEFS